ncbi:right-handed parallel beta-helix repeat-containing protein [Zobellia amurskyensis]|nr:right-handed parallel beta-helix repeat-containing protein [Zobellia amurskyensis]
MTDALQSAITSAFDTVIVDRKYSPWYTKPLVFRNLKNKVIIFEAGVEIIAQEGGFPNTDDSLITFMHCKGISLIGNSATLCMLKDEYLTGEWRHGISIRGSDSIKIESLTIRNTGGDGVYIAGSKEKRYSENIIIKKIESINNKRQGLSIISGKRISISESIFSDTSGTLPGSGLDIEPNTFKDVVNNIQVSDCIFENNYGAGVTLGLGKLNSLSEKISINFSNCVLTSNHAPENKTVPAQLIIGSNAKSPIKGDIMFENCLFESSDWGMLYSRKLANSFEVSFKDCLVRNLSKNGSSPIVYFEVADYSENYGSLGGFDFQNLKVETENPVIFMTVRGSKKGTLRGVDNITGRVISTSLNDKKIEYLNYLPILNKNVSLIFVEN